MQIGTKLEDKAGHNYEVTGLKEKDARVRRDDGEERWVWLATINAMLREGNLWVLP